MFDGVVEKIQIGKITSKYPIGYWFAYEYASDVQEV